MMRNNSHRLPGLRLGVLLMMASVVLSSCSILQAVALKDCEYEYEKVENVTFLGMQKKDLLSVTGIYKVTRALTGNADEVPLGFTLYLKVTNPNNKMAAVDKIFYTVDLDTIQVAQGSCVDEFTVAPLSTAQLPLRLEMDLKTLLSNRAYGSLGNAVRNFIGVSSDRPTTVTVQLRPVVRVAGVALSVPKSIPIRFTYGGEEKSSTEGTVVK